MKHYTQKWDRCNDQGPALVTINTCCQLIGIIGTGLYHLMADVQLTVDQTVDLVLSASTDLTLQAEDRMHHVNNVVVMQTE